jgi:hypothetical protein
MYPVLSKIRSIYNAIKFRLMAIFPHANVDSLETGHYHIFLEPENRGKISPPFLWYINPKKCNLPPKTKVLHLINHN